MDFVPPPEKQLFYEQVWAIAQQIPHGKVATYGQITRIIPQPEGSSTEQFSRFGAQWVGQAMGACPDDVPWQRVVNSQGKISHQAQAVNQIRLLESEGVLFFGEKVDLGEFQWRGPGQSDQPEQGRLF